MSTIIYVTVLCGTSLFARIASMHSSLIVAGEKAVLGRYHPSASSGIHKATPSHALVSGHIRMRASG